MDLVAVSSILRRYKQSAYVASNMRPDGCECLCSWLEYKGVSLLKTCMCTNASYVTQSRPIASGSHGARTHTGWHTQSKSPVKYP